MTISIPDLWGEQQFVKTQWGGINYLVGPNGTGKSRFAEQLRAHCKRAGLRVRYLSSERLAGLESQAYSYFGSSALQQGLSIGEFPRYRQYGTEYGLSADAFVALKEKVDVRIRIEAILSQLFGKRIRLAEEGGYLNPKVERLDWGKEYGFRESECHGLKELVTLLAFLFDDDYNCLIIDEPELHLHPQFQTFFLQQMRALAGDPSAEPNRKIFFIVTHSPYYVDIRTPEDLKHCVVFNSESSPPS